ncbi:MAG: hypothetical protein ABI661_06065 [Gammaproteobacteria bacterium]
MSNELMVVLAAASVAALVGGGLVAWVTTRHLPVSDPEEEGRQALLLVELQETVVHSRQRCLAAELQVQTVQSEFGKAGAHIGTLEDQVAAYLRQYAQAKNTLKAEIRQKSRLATELAAASAQITALQGRVAELEMERNAITGSLRRLSA